MKKHAISGIFGLATLLCLTSCGGTSSKGPDGRTLINYIGVYDTFSQDAMIDLVNTYNDTQGVVDGVYVNPTWSTGEYGQYSSALSKNTRYNVVTVGCDQFKALALRDYFVQLDDPTYLTNEIKEQLQYDDITDDLKNTFRFNGSNKNANGKYEAGYGMPLRGMPFTVNPHVVYYNSKIFAKCGFNIISVPENKLDAYNAEHGSLIMPHGYAEYKNSPFEGAISSTNAQGDTVYKVFNNAIAMNWEELRMVSHAFQHQYQYNFGFMSEWWFSYGFSVGGDCIGWNESTNNYDFTLCDKNANYLATEDVTVNGTNYAKGRVLHYEDASYVNANKLDSATKAKLYEMPSQYEAFKEFNRLGVPSNCITDEGDYGYGLAPNTTTDRAKRFLSGTDCPLLIEELSNASSYVSSLKTDFDITLTPQYREYVGGSVYGDTSKINTQELKVIGETYDGEVYTGELKKVNGTAAVGENQSAGRSMALCIPKNSDPQKYNAAMKFIAWACGKDGQGIVSSTNSTVPVQTSLAFSDEFLNKEGKVINNIYAASLQSRLLDVGDYDYFQAKTWIDPWAVLLNNDVRQGKVTLTSFINQVQANANTALQQMTLRLYGR